jgi:hypothetical protein
MTHHRRVEDGGDTGPAITIITTVTITTTITTTTITTVTITITIFTVVGGDVGAALYG